MILTASHTNIGGRNENEDSVREIRKGENLCLVVADGLGGHGGGALASALATEQICKYWGGGADTSELEKLILLAHESVKSIQTPACAMKTTSVVLTMEGRKAAWAHVGDSRLYHFHNGKLVFQTRDHSASQIAVILGEITQDQIRFHEDRSRILRALGQEDDLPVETHEEILAPGEHAFLLCSDGFWEYVLEPEMEEDLTAAKEPKEWLDRMVARLLGRVKENNDNNTAGAAWVAI